MRIALIGIFICVVLPAAGPSRADAQEQDAQEREDRGRDLSVGDGSGDGSSNDGPPAQDRRGPVAGNDEVERLIKNWTPRGAVKDDSKPAAPRQALELLDVHPDFELDVVLHEPQVRQPLYMTWDERGRLWVVQYLQYPFPAGLKVLRYDQYLRAVFDKVPPAPPHHVRGADKISVHEDTDGDGEFDVHTDVITGLNIVSAVALGRGGIWVLNPPYLLFYPEADGDDIPDGDPEVHLSGFGLEDTHSVASSLHWGPDGWLYGANGSTTTAQIRSTKTPGTVSFEGQCLWRYHPESREFEVFAEGGGNTFSLEFDAAGRTFAGTNYGQTRGMHYVQGGYGVKNWGKHGPLTNPYAFGFFQHMRHEGFNERFSQAICIYDAGAFPPRYRQSFIAANSLHRRVVPARLERDGSSWRTVDQEPLITSRDRWFRPVDIKVGPDGNVWIADWYDSRLSHNDPRDNWHKSSGRIYRLRPKDAPSGKRIDLGKQSSDALVDILLTHEDRWHREEALRLLTDRRDASVVPRLRRVLTRQEEGRALEALWGLNACRALDGAAVQGALASDEPHVRRWAVRFIGDAGAASAEVAARLTHMAEVETDLEVRSQLASTAKRLPAKEGLAVLLRLAARADDRDDPHIPLLIWWAVEDKAERARAEILAALEEPTIWDLPLIQSAVIERLAQRYAMAGGDENWLACARLLELAPSDGHTARLISGIEAAFRGREIGTLPPQLSRALEAWQKRLGSSDLALALRRKDPQAVDEALKIIVDAEADKATRLHYIEILGEVREARSVSSLKQLLRTTGASSINRTALEALRNYDDPSIAGAILSAYGTTLPDEHGLRGTAHRVLASRKTWALPFLEEIDRWRIKKEDVAVDVVQQLALYDDPKIRAIVEKLWGKVRGATSEEKQAEAQRIRRILRDIPAMEKASRLRGRVTFGKLCSRCHTLFDEGGRAGPELTGYERDNLAFLVPAIVDPSLAIREEFTNFLVVTKDGRTLTGLIDRQDSRTVTLRDVENQTIVVVREEIERLQALDTSLMPEDLTTPLAEAEIRDLFAYLMGRIPIIGTSR